MTNAAGALPREQVWPNLPLDEWADTCATLHMWMQIVGKIRLRECAWVNHSWNATFYVTASGVTTTSIPAGSRIFQIDFDFVRHQLTIQASDGRTAGFPLEPLSVAEFYRRLAEEMRGLDLPVRIYPRPNEVPEPIRFDQDETHRAYDREYANRF